MTTDHSAQLEEVMAYLDGQMTGDAAERVRLHLAACAECRKLEAEMTDLTNRLSAWDVGPAPASLRPRTRPWWRTTPALLAAAAALVVIIATPLLMPRRSPATSARAAAIGASEQKQDASRPPARTVAAAVPAPAAVARATPAEGSLIIRTAYLTVVPRDFEAARAELERLIARAGGFVGRIVSRGERGSPRVLEATLRVPAARLDDTLTGLRALGHVSGETREGEDVTRQSADLDSRLANARTSETRLRALLERRTGDLADVLAVERELARVRYDIESMEAQRKSLDQQVTYATVQVTLTEERKAEVDLGPASLSTRVRNAFVDGWATALELVVGTALVAIRVMPTLLLATVALIPGVVWWRRRRR